jgi:hypothetical protein
MNQRDRDALDRYITGDYGERQFADARRFCDVHASVTDDETTLGDPYAERDAEADHCPDCQALANGADCCGTCGRMFPTTREAIDHERGCQPTEGA